MKASSKGVTEAEQNLILLFSIIIPIVPTGAGLEKHLLLFV